ncbi:MAG: hypothetical protein K2N24_10270 [Lachnospiraceae bacterium]|nr:hypothetical protein [Lachnospiraceae bacterium]
MKPEKLNTSIKKRYIILIILVLLILFPYIKVEIHTFLFGGQFRNLYDASGWIENVRYFKVMEYNNSCADILYVSDSENEGSKATFLYHFQKINDQWELESWECLWSRSGNAEKFFYPYYPHW